ncbi:hypothetical protein COOONC_14652, partial [Cooperia oncophora]
AIARRNNLYPRRRDFNYLTSLEKHISDKSVSDGFRHYAPIVGDTGDGFYLVIINETQREWLADFSQRGIGIDDTFNVSMYKLRLATIIVADHCDRALPAAFMLSFRMSENELVVLFDKVKELVPAFAPEFFMSDDAPSFYNAFRRVFPEAQTRKILCNWHVLQTFKRSARKKLTKPSLFGEFMSRIRLVSRSCKSTLFTKRYGDTLTFLLNQNQHEMVDYLHQNWTNRIEEWAAHHRRGAVMNTSMMCERWHKHLKREVFGSKSKIRIDELVDALITAVKEMKEDAAVIEHRGLVEGRFRLQNHHISHNKAISNYLNLKQLITVVEPGLWKIRSPNSNKFFMVEEERCTCKKALSHCRKPGCSVLIHSFANATMTARQESLACTFMLPFYTHQKECTSFQATLRMIASQPSEQAEQSSSDLFASMKQIHSDAKERLSMLAPAAQKMRTIAVRPEVPMRGPAPKDAKPIRMKTKSCINREKRKTKFEAPKEFSSAEVRVCGSCFLENPIDNVDDDIYWLKCTFCDCWGHLGSCVALSAQCTVCSSGKMEYSEC